MKGELDLPPLPDYLQPGLQVVLMSFIKARVRFWENASSESDRGLNCVRLTSLTAIAYFRGEIPELPVETQLQLQRLSAPPARRRCYEIQDARHNLFIL